MSTTIVSDTFTDTNGTAINSHTIGPTNTPSASWSAPFVVAGVGASPTCTIQSNALVCSGTGTTGVGSYLDSGLADCQLSQAVKVIAANAVGLNGFVFRLTDTSNYWIADLQTDSSGSLLIREVNSGSSTTRASQSASVPSGSTFTATVTLIGSSIVFAGAGTSVSYTSTSMQTNTKHGVCMVYNGSISGGADNFVVLAPTYGDSGVAPSLLVPVGGDDEEAW